MFAYVKMNYGMITDVRVDIRKLGELLGVLLAVMLLLFTAERQTIKAPVREAAEISRNMSENMAGELDLISDISTENMLRKIAEGVTGIQIDQAVLLSKASVVVPEVPKTDIPEKTVRAVDLEYPMTIQTVPEAMPDEPKTVPEEGAIILDPAEPPSENTAEEIQPFSCRGFLCDASGKIIGCDGGISVTDGVLCLPSDQRCTGVAAGALSELGEAVFEIYIPANIISIEEGAFDGLTEFLFIQVHSDNPVYGSSCGELYKK